jgi:hypothetical protein
MSKISVTQASLLFKVTARTIYNWIKADGIKAQNDLYSVDDLQDAYDKRRKPKPRLRFK